MTNTEEIGGSALHKFLDTWYRHPLSLSIVTISINLMFTYMLSNNRLDQNGIITIVAISFGLSFIIICIIYFILYYKKEVLYNILDMLSNRIKTQMTVVQEKLIGIKIGIGTPYEDYVEQLSLAKSKSPAAEQTRDEIKLLSYLKYLLKSCGIDIPINGKTYLALAKFYYKEGNYQKALENIDNITEDKKATFSPGEISFCKGLILEKLRRDQECQKFFHEATVAGNNDAKCWECMRDVELNEECVDRFIKKAKECDNRHIKEHCISGLSTAYYRKAKYFSNNDLNARSYNLRKAVEIAQTAIDEFDSWASYFNKACDLSVMAQYKISLYSNKSFNDIEVQNDMKKQIFYCLGRAFNSRPALMEYALIENDLRWVRENCEKEYNELCGKIFNRCNGLQSSEYRPEFIAISGQTITPATKQMKCSHTYRIFFPWKRLMPGNMTRRLNTRFASRSSGFARKRSI